MRRPASKPAPVTGLVLPVLLLVSTLLLPVGSKSAVPKLPSEPALVEVESVVDGDTVILSDQRQVRLVGIQAPKLPLGRKGFETWPLAETAKRALEELTLGQKVRLAYGGRRMDRHGRALAHLYVTDKDGEEIWIQGRLLEAGMARVYSFADNRALIDPMLARERAARRAGRGIWADGFYAIRDSDALDPYIDSFQLVQGRVQDVAVVKGRVYLNFGPDWRSDFTVVLQPPTRRLFVAEGLDVADYDARDIRVRGWLKTFNGPMIEVTHPEQIEVLEP